MVPVRCTDLVSIFVALETSLVGSGGYLLSGYMKRMPGSGRGRT